MDLTRSKFPIKHHGKHILELHGHKTNACWLGWNCPGLALPKSSSTGCLIVQHAAAFLLKSFLFSRFVPNFLESSRDSTAIGWPKNPWQIWAYALFKLLGPQTHLHEARQDPFLKKCMQLKSDKVLVFLGVLKGKGGKAAHLKIQSHQFFSKPIIWVGIKINLCFKTCLLKALVDAMKLWKHKSTLSSDPYLLCTFCLSLSCVAILHEYSLFPYVHLQAKL